MIRTATLSTSATMAVVAACAFATAASTAAASSPAATSPGVTPSAATPGVAWTAPTYAHGVNVAAADGVVAVASPQGKHANLLVSEDGAAPAPVAAGPLPAWGQPHVGTNAAGDPVITYPRCAGAAVSSCDLYVWDVDAGRESQVAGVNGRAGEIEGVEDRGNVLVARARATKTQPGDLAIYGNPDEATTLLFRPTGGRARVLSAKGGRQLALRGSRIAQVRNTYVATDGGSNDDSPTLELLSTKSSAVRRVRKMVSGEAFQTFTAPTFVGNRLIAGIRWTDRRGYVLRYDLAKGTTRISRASAQFLTYAATSNDGGYQLTAKAQGTPPSTDVYTLSTVQ